MRILWLVLLALVWAPDDASAQLFSPGKLAKSHAQLEGLRSCTKCHPKGGKLSASTCLGCHVELKSSVANGLGYHGRLPDSKSACETCHHDHKGRKYNMIRWREADFEHREAGWVLKGAHKEAKCKTCHQPRRIAKVSIKKLLEHKNKRRTFLGLPKKCKDCHFDEHRGQLSLKCGDCHSEKAFAPAKGFKHSDSGFAIRGKHKKVDCDKCHDKVPDTKTSAKAFPAPEARDFALYQPLEHERCTDCHDDPHRKRFGPRCTDCHSERGWNRLKTKSVKRKGFHQKTRYPLQGQHEFVACDACHLPLGKGRKVFRGLKYKRCDHCHLDAHQGQLEGDCSDCHDLNGFSPAQYDAAAHAKTDYAIEGAHLAVGCGRCHEAQRRLKKPSKKLLKALKRRKRAYLVSSTRLSLKGRKCVDCHKDPHGGQFKDRTAKEGCQGCHSSDAWSTVRLDHDTQTGFPLKGGHTQVGCEACHVAAKKGAPVVYRAVRTDCIFCHEDEHSGQFAADGKTDCARCHTSGTFEVKAFEHDKARFVLAGKHEGVACKKCHLKVKTKARTLVRYRPLPSNCEKCHADYHEGAFDSRLGPASGQQGCAGCHNEKGWSPAQLEHELVGWRLGGRHRSARCGACHGSDLSRALPKDCNTCHSDPHRGDLGSHCEGCHDQGPEPGVLARSAGPTIGVRPWASRFDVSAHQGTAFPLAGAHAVIPCEECHSDSFGRGFVRAAPGCVRCHADQYESAALTSIDHRQAGFDLDCQRCHTPWDFKRAKFEAHDACFAISAGSHAGLTCDSCHDSLQGATTNGQCNTQSVVCTGCHDHRQSETDEAHREVPGYQYKDQKCYECHSFVQR